MTGFDKTRLPHTSNSLTLIASNLTTQYAISYNFHTMLSLLYVITSPNLKLIAHFHTELWSFKVVNLQLDVCGSLVLSNPVTYVTGSTKTVLIAQDRKFDFFTQTQSLMNALSSFTATVDQSKVVCFCWLLF